MNQPYEDAVEAIKAVESAEANAAAEGVVTITMSTSEAVQTFATLHIGIKVTEEEMASDLKRRSLPSPFTRITLSQLRAAAAAIERAIRERPMQDGVANG